MCGPCNRRHNEDTSAYMRFMNERYGPRVVAELDGLRRCADKVSDDELRRTLALHRSLL